MPAALDDERRWLKPLAERELSGISDTLRNEYWQALLAVFEQWKQEHGARDPSVSPRPSRKDGYGLADVGRRIDFHDAKPYQCAGYGVYNNIDLAFRLWLNRYPPFEQFTKTLGSKLLGTCKCFALLALKDEAADAPSLLRAVCFLTQTWLTVDEAVKAFAPMSNERKKTKKQLTRAQASGRLENKIRANSVLGLLLESAIQVKEKHPKWKDEQILDHILNWQGFNPTMKNGKPYSRRSLLDMLRGRRKETPPTNK